MRKHEFDIRGKHNAMIALYDTNLSWRLQFGVLRFCVYIDWWYDVSSRQNKHIPLEFRFFNFDFWNWGKPRIEVASPPPDDGGKWWN